MAVKLSSLKAGSKIKIKVTIDDKSLSTAKKAFKQSAQAINKLLKPLLLVDKALEDYRRLTHKTSLELQKDLVNLGYAGIKSGLSFNELGAGVSTFRKTGIATTRILPNLIKQSGLLAKSLDVDVTTSSTFVSERYRYLGLNANQTAESFVGAINMSRKFGFSGNQLLNLSIGPSLIMPYTLGYMAGRKFEKSFASLIGEYKYLGLKFDSLKGLITEGMIPSSNELKKITILAYTTGSNFIKLMSEIKQHPQLIGIRQALLAEKVVDMAGTDVISMVAMGKGFGLPDDLTWKVFSRKQKGLPKLSVEMANVFRKTRTQADYFMTLDEVWKAQNKSFYLGLETVQNQFKLFWPTALRPTLGLFIGGAGNLLGKLAPLVGKLNHSKLFKSILNVLTLTVSAVTLINTVSKTFKFASTLLVKGALPVSRVNGLEAGMTSKNGLLHNLFGSSKSIKLWSSIGLAASIGTVIYQTSKIKTTNTQTPVLIQKPVRKHVTRTLKEGAKYYNNKIGKQIKPAQIKANKQAEDELNKLFSTEKVKQHREKEFTKRSNLKTTVYTKQILMYSDNLIYAQIEAFANRIMADTDLTVSDKTKLITKIKALLNKYNFITETINNNVVFFEPKQKLTKGELNRVIKTEGELARTEQYYTMIGKIPSIGLLPTKGKVLQLTPQMKSLLEAQGPKNLALKIAIIQHEGIRNTTYMDTTGHATIGIGHFIKPNENIPYQISNEQIITLFQKDFKTHALAASKFPGFNKLDPVRQAMIVDLTFNMGANWWKSRRGHGGWPRLVKQLQQHDFEAAFKNLYMSLWARQVGANSPRGADIFRWLRTGEGPQFEGFAARGKLVNKPMQLIVGEKEPEVVIPLTALKEYFNKIVEAIINIKNKKLLKSNAIIYSNWLNIRDLVLQRQESIQTIYANVYNN